MYDLLGTCLALAALLGISAFASLAAMWLWYALAGLARRWRPATRAQLLFSLRTLPVASAFLVVAALLVPAYIAYEPKPTGETVSLKLAGLAFLSMVGIALALWRGLASWRATRRLVHDWMRYAEPVSIENVPVPVYCVEHQFPVIAVVGVLRPRLFIARRIFGSLSSDELSAAVLHEIGHLAARDNLKRVLMRLCRDALVIVPVGRALDRAWAESAEAAADEHAAQRGSLVALDLAAALVKIARMVQEGTRPTMPAGAFLIGEEVGGVAYRVQNLMQISDANDQLHRSREAMMLSITTWACTGALLLFAIYAATSPRVLATLHAGMEWVVTTLS